MKRLMICLVIVSAIFVFVASAVSARTYGYGAGNPGSITYSVGSAVAKLFTEKANIQTVVQPHGGPNAFVPGVNAGELDFCGANVLELRYALTGTKYFQGRPMPNLRVVSVLLPLRTAFFVKADSPIKSLKDLKGKRIPSDYSAQKVVYQITTGLLANAGLTWDDVKHDPVANVNRGADDFMEGKVDAFFFDITSGKVQEAASKVGELRALPVDPSAEAMARFRESMPVAYPFLQESSKVFPGIEEPTYVAAFDFVLLTNSKQPDDLIYKLTKTLYNGKKDLTSYFKPLGDEFSQDKMAKVLPNGEYHEGAIKFYKEVGLWPPKEGVIQK
jgi:TRAP transporter TAXI family solute receptor